MAKARIASKTQSKIGALIYGAQFTGKSTLASQFVYFKRTDGSPFRVLYIDAENGSIDDYIEKLENDGIDTGNLYIVYTQSLGEVKEMIAKVKNNEDFYVLDDDGNETDEVLLDASGQPFRADAIVIDGSTILNLSLKQSLIEFSKKRNAVKAKAQGLVGDERLVKVENAGLEIKDYGVINFKSQDLILDLMSAGCHYVITARETNEKESVKDKNGQIASVDTGKKIPEGFKGLLYNVKTVIRTYLDEDGTVCAIVEKDRTGVHSANEVIEDPSLLDWQAVIDKTAKNKKFVIENSLVQSVEKEQNIYAREVLGSAGKPVDNIESAEDNSNIPNKSNVDSLIASINDKMKSFSVTNKNVAKKALEDKGLPASPKAIKAETSEDTLKQVLEVLNNV